MAVTDQPAVPEDGAGPERAEAPGRGIAFVPDPRRTIGYRICRAIFQAVIRLWFRPRVTGRQHVPVEGPVILAPVHRSLADFSFAAFVTRRKIFFMAKDDLWKNRFLGWLLVTLGAFPVHRESADREAVRHAEEVLKRGEALVLFPEGTRQVGEQVEELLEGASFLAARTGAVIVPIGIGNSDAAMPKGRKIPKRLRIEVVVGEPLAPPAKSERGRVSRSSVKKTTDELRQRIQAVYDEARARTQR